jgi:short-subunit dehydrogenase involved in D-alanine esterification of teichoic acids
MALLASAVGNTTLKSPLEDVLSAPKSNTQTAGSPETLSLNINAPLAVIVALLTVLSAKSVKAVVPDVEGSTLVRVSPFAVYPVPEAALLVV